MKKLFFLFALLLSQIQALAVSGDILGATVEGSGYGNGWVLDVRVSAVGTNLAFNFGSITNYKGWISPMVMIPGCSVVLTVISPGFDQTGTSNAVTRYVYGTQQLRCLYGINGQTSGNYINDVTNQSGDAVIRLALSSEIFSNDVVSVAIAANWYGANNANASVPTTNSSTMGYGSTVVVGRFSQPQYDRITANSYTVRAVGFNRYGQRGSMAACAIFTAQDAHGHSNTTTVANMTYDKARGDAVPVCEWVATMNASGFTAGDIITNNVKIYPWVGDANAVLDTSDGKFGAADPYYGPLYMLADQANQYGTFYAYVNSTNGVGTTTGQAVQTLWTFGSEPRPFASINEAAAAIAASNNIVFSHNDSGGGYILIAGTNSFSGSGAASTTAGKTWLTISNAPGYVGSLVDGTGAGNVNNRTKICGNITITSSDSFTFSAISNLWFDGVTFDCPSTGQDLIDGAGFHWATRCTILNFDQGLRNQGSQNTVFAMVRGCWFLDAVSALPTPLDPYCMIGNYLDSAKAFSISTERSALPRVSQMEIIAFNVFKHMTNSGTSTISMHNTVDCTNGAVLFQNMFEGTDTNDNDTIYSLGSDSSTANITNFIKGFNTMLGGKDNENYNDNGTTPVWRVSGVNFANLIGDYNIKGDAHNGGTGPSAGRTGNQASYYGVDHIGECYTEYSAEPSSHSSGQFINLFPGLGSYQPIITLTPGEPGGASNYWNFPKFLNDQTYNGTNAVGGGDYHLQVIAPAHNLSHPGLWMVPVDIDGRARSTLDPSGAYASGGYKQTSVFCFQ